MDPWDGPQEGGSAHQARKRFPNPERGADVLELRSIWRSAMREAIGETSWCVVRATQSQAAAPHSLEPGDVGEGCAMWLQLHISPPPFPMPTHLLNQSHSCSVQLRGVCVVCVVDC